MNVKFGTGRYCFRPWRQADGRVFTATFAFDCETMLIDPERPWLTPTYVIGAAFDGIAGYFITPDRVAAFFAAHEGTPIVMHNAPFDLGVIHMLSPSTDIYKCVDQDRVWDTQLLHRLYVLGSQGHAAGGTGESDLDHCTETYLDLRLQKDIKDSDGNLVRYSYGRWLNKPPTDIEPVYLEYLAKDVIATQQIYEKLHHLLQELLERSQGVWGYVSPEWLNEQIRKWGPQTHHIQLRASIVLHSITANGLHLDTTRRAKLVETLRAVLEKKCKALRKFGYIPGQPGSGKALQAIFKRLEYDHPGMDFSRTDTGLFATSLDALQDLAHIVPFVRLLMEYRTTEKLLTSFLTKMGKSVLHPAFNVLARTGRTSSFGEINAQNLPKDDAVRSCFVAALGFVFLDLDYKMIELVTLAQACIAQFGLTSKMAEAINALRDLHKLVAAKVMVKPESDVTKAERAMAKPINFGKPGGMGDRTLMAYAKTSYGVQLTDEQVAELSRAWFELYPEMKEFLGDSTDAGKDVAEVFRLTPASHYDHTGDRRFVGHPDNLGREERPHPILGGMLLKVLKAPDPHTRDGKPYPAGDLDYFWSRVEDRLELLPAKLHQAVRDRQPSARLQRAVCGLVGRAGVFTLTGRLRAHASYCARHNTIFQGLAADGAKLALWLLWRAGYRVANFIHDQVLLEVPAESDLIREAKRASRLMIQGMKEVVPDVRVDVSYAATERWHKDAEAVFDKTGKKLLLWTPKPKKEKARVGTA